MNNRQLQEAIDKARDFMKAESVPGGLLHQSRDNTRLLLKELEKIQLTRASMMTSPRINPL